MSKEIIMIESEVARYLVNRIFAGKLDLGGEPYKEHLYRVAENAIKINKEYSLDLNENDLVSIALLHDIIEDYPKLFNFELLGAMFNNNIAFSVSKLTREKSVNYEAYIDSVSISGIYAIVVKIADLKDNLNLSRLKEITDSDWRRAKKYSEAIILLTEKLETYRKLS